MSFRSAEAALLIVAVSAALAAGCGPKPGTSSGTVSRDPNILVAYVCCGFVPAIEDAKIQFETENKGKSIRIEGDEPGALVERIRSGAIPDIFICPGDSEMGMLEREGFLDRGTRQEIGSLRVAIAVRGDDPVVIKNSDYLTSDEVGSITMPTPGITSLGTDGKRALERAGVWSELQDKLTLQTSALEALKEVAEGNADAAIAYDPCFAMYVSDKIPPGSVRIAAPVDPSDERPVSIYIVLHKRSPNALLAQRLIRLLQSRQIVPPGIPPLPAEEAE